MVSENYKRGFINKEGKVVIPCKYDDASDFQKDYQECIKIINLVSLISRGRL